MSDKSWLTCVRLGVRAESSMQKALFHCWPQASAGSFLSGSLPSTSSEAATARTSKRCSSQMTGSEMPGWAHTTLESMKLCNAFSEIQPAKTSQICKSIFLITKKKVPTTPFLRCFECWPGPIAPIWVEVTIALRSDVFRDCAQLELDTLWMGAQPTGDEVNSTYKHIFYKYENYI